ncbi:MAG: substrate-binding domain-containing protein [Prevotella sp.]|nr:substrate-binding domain-containing protein [Prevotella sp.]
MKMNTFNKLVGLTLSLGLFLACGNKPKSLPYDYEAAARAFTSDESFYPILDEELEVFALHAEGELEAIYTDQEDAIRRLMKNEVWLAFATRQLSQKEMDGLKSKNFLPRVIPIAYDGLAIIVNNANPDTCISVKDFARILSGEVSNWKDLYPNSKLGEIDVVFDNPKSSTVTWCVDSILGGKPIDSHNIGAVKKSAEVIDWVEKHENALGIIGSNWLNDKHDTTNVTFKKNITVMKVSRLDSATVRNSWRPYQYYLYNGNYPLVRTIYAILNEPRSGVPSNFAHFCRLPKGQLIFLRAGLLPVQAGVEVRDVHVRKQ